MTDEYYIKLYELRQEDAATFREMTVGPGHAAEVIEALARRWTDELQPRCTSEVQCRAVFFREVITSCRDAGMPNHLAIAWAHHITDRVAERVLQMRETW